MTVFHPDTVRLMGQRYSEFQAYKKNILQQFCREIREICTFSHLSIRTFSKIRKENRIRAMYDQRILKNLWIYRKIHKLKRFGMVFSHSAYKRTFISCFFAAASFAVWDGLFPLCSPFFSLFPCVSLIGFTSLSAKSEVNRDRVLTKKGEQEENTEKSDEKRKKIGKTAKDYLKDCFPEINDIRVIPGARGPAIVIYTRVSSWGQVNGGKSLPFQEKELMGKAEENLASKIYFISDAGKTGKDFSHRKLGIILQLAAAGKIEKLYVSGVDRIGRNAFELLCFVFQLRLYDVTIVTPVEEFNVKKLISLITLAVKAAGAEDQNNNRGIYALRTKVGNFKDHEWNLSFPIGYESKGDWIAKTPGWEPVIREIFLFFLEFKEYSAVCRLVEQIHGDFLQKNLKEPLTPEKIKAILENPIYMGKPQFSGEATQKNFGSVFHIEISLKYVEKDTFEDAQEIIKALNKKHARQKKPVNEIVAIFGWDALKFLPHVGVFCPKCKNRMKSDGAVYYICPKCKTHLDGIKKTQLQALGEYALNRERGLELLSKLRKQYKWTGASAKTSREIELLLKKIDRKDKNYEVENTVDEIN